MQVSSGRPTQRVWIVWGAALTLGLLAGSPLAAQTTQAPAAGSKQVIPEKQGAPMKNGRSDSLSNRLSETNGVIKPNTDIDPGIKAPTPDTSHQMPVIKPGATDGGAAK